MPPAGAPQMHPVHLPSTSSPGCPVSHPHHQPLRTGSAASAGLHLGECFISSSISIYHCTCQLCQQPALIFSLKKSLDHITGAYYLIHVCSFQMNIQETHQKDKAYAARSLVRMLFFVCVCYNCFINCLVM